MLSSLKISTTFGLVMVALGGTIPATMADPGQACARVQQINNFKYLDDTSAILETGPSEKFKVTFSGKCPALKHATAIRVESHPGMCLRPGDVIVFSLDGVIPERCTVSSVTALPAS